MRGGCGAGFLLLGACYQPEFHKDSGGAAAHTGGPAPTPELPETTIACITAFPSSGDASLHSDAPRVGALETTPDTVASECAASGQTCDPSAWISHDAAACIGPHQGVEAGPDGEVYAALRFDSAMGAVVWIVENDLGLRGDGSEAWGLGVALDAESGAVRLGPYEWREAVGD